MPNETEHSTDFDPASALGIEKELETEHNEIVRPFNPEKIKVGNASPTINLILDRIEHREIDLEPDFQRRARIWKKEKKSQLIESLLLRIPLPAFYVASDEKENWSVVDGLQRLTTIFDFCSGDFSLSGMEYLKKLNGALYKDLPRNMKRRIAETELYVNVIEQGTPEEVMFNIFKRINTGGESLNSQEIRNALHKGPVRNFLQDLANEESFRKATDGAIPSERMMDREFVLRFLSFYISPWEQYKEGYLDNFLSSAMTKINAMSEKDRASLRKEFIDSMDVAYKIFDSDAFRKRYNVNDPRKPINKSLFETWSVNIAKLSEEDRAKLVKNHSIIKDKFRHALNKDRDFELSISSSTALKTRITTRFKVIKQIISEALDAEPSHT